MAILQHFRTMPRALTSSDDIAADYGDGDEEAAAADDDDDDDYDA